MNKRYKQFLTTIGSMGLLAVIFDTFPMLIRSVDYFLESKQFTVGAVLMLMVPFFMILSKLSKEKEKRARALLVERRQLQIAFNLNEIMEALKVESKWSLQEIGSTHTDHLTQKKLFSYLQAATKHLKIRRVKKMNLLKNPWSKKLFAFLLLVLVNGLNDTLGLNLSHDTVNQITGVGQIYIISQAAVDMFKPLIMIILSKFSIKQEVTNAKLPMDTESSV